MYLIGEVAWLLAEQAHRYQEDLSRLGDERDALVAQHDADAETIGSLRADIPPLHDTIERLIFERDEARSLAEGFERDRDAVLADLSAANAERDEARAMLKLAEGVAAALPDPDTSIPEHLRFARDVLNHLDVGMGDELDWVNNIMTILESRYLTLEGIRAQAYADEKVIEQAARHLADSTWVGDIGTARDLAANLHAAGMLKAVSE